MKQPDVFSPFRRREEGHEDRLTWGLMVALKYIPELQRRLRDLVLERLPAGRWPTRADWEPGAVSTQTSRLGPEVGFVISVLLSDESLPVAVGVQGAKRSARYDAVLEYADGLALIVENKPRRANVWPAQLSPSLDSFHDPEGVEVYEEAISLEWAEVVEAVHSYTSSPLATYTERSLGRDFISFVEDLHPGLSPYRTFELCGGRPAAFDRRVERLLESIGDLLGCEVGLRPGKKAFLNLPTRAVRQLHADVYEARDDSGFFLRVNLWPGDTVGQAQPFFQRVDRAAFLDLRSEGWKVKPNLHFSHVQKHLVWSATRTGVSGYLDHYLEHRGEIGRKQFDQDPLEDLITYWLARGLISLVDVEKLRDKFGETGRNYLNVVPGFTLTREWPMHMVIEMESEDRLEKEIISAVRVPLATWGEEIGGIGMSQE